MARVARELRLKMKEMGAKKAAKELRVCLASFYNYILEKSLPRTEVLWRASKKWGIKWPMLDVSQMMKTQKIDTPEQLALSFIEAVREGDLEIITVESSEEGQLQVKLRIHFLPTRMKRAVGKA